MIIDLPSKQLVTNSRMASMKKSPIHPKYEVADYGDYGFDFDPQVDFSEFLEEARKHGCKENSETVTPYPQGKKQLGEAKKNKKSWKRSLFSWWKADKRSNASMEAQSSDNISKPNRGYVSGPIYGSGGGGGGGGGVGDSCKPRRPTSGPLTSLFQQTKRVKNEIPYMCLDQINNPHGVQYYGPVYLVT